MTPSISRSSIALNASASISPGARFSRAALSAPCATGCRHDRRETAVLFAAFSTPHFIWRFPRSSEAWPIARLRTERCPLRSRRSRIAATGKADRESTYLVASSMRRLISSFFSSAPLFEVTRPSTTLLLALGEEAQRLEAAGALGVVFEEIAVKAVLPSSCSATELVSARSNKGRAEIAAAECMVTAISAGLPSSAALVRRA